VSDLAQDRKEAARAGPAAPARPAGPLVSALPALLYAVFLYFLSDRALPPDLLPRFAGADKLAHAAAYAGFGALLLLPLRKLAIPGGAAVLAAAALASAYGAADEWHQSHVPGRDADPIDWLADTGGGALGAAGLGRALRRRARVGRATAGPPARELP